MLIGFTHKTSKLLPRIFCRRFRHCAVVVVFHFPLPRRAKPATPSLKRRGIYTKQFGHNTEFQNKGIIPDNKFPFALAKGCHAKHDGVVVKITNLKNQLPFRKERKKYIMLSASCGKLNFIPLSSRDLKILEMHGWVFIECEVLSVKCEIIAAISHFKLNTSHLGQMISAPTTCVQFAKRVIGMRAPFIQTPNQLYKSLLREKKLFAKIRAQRGKQK